MLNLVALCWNISRPQQITPHRSQLNLAFKLCSHPAKVKVMLLQTGEQRLYLKIDFSDLLKTISFRKYIAYPSTSDIRFAFVWREQGLRGRSHWRHNFHYFDVVMKWVLYPMMTARATEKVSIMGTSEGVHIAGAMHRKTRLHSSGMHTARLLTISPSMHCTGSASGGCLLPGGVCSGGWYPSMHWGRPPPL